MLARWYICDAQNAVRSGGPYRLSVSGASIRVDRLTWAIAKNAEVRVMVKTTTESVQCQRCGRKLRTPKAMELGYGRVCHSKYKAEKAKEEMDRNQMRLELDGVN
ncbi:DUF6011 domain-containing protein [Sporomusa ovata]|nr:DUF6011 domain-containing protein [Sporomusa ovata]